MSLEDRLLELEAKVEEELTHLRGIETRLLSLTATIRAVAQHELGIRRRAIAKAERKNETIDFPAPK